MKNLLAGLWARGTILMPTNKYFDHNPKHRSGEQDLYEDLLVELIQIHGYEMYYLPREALETMDQLFGENVNSYFEKAYPIEMYINNNESWNGPSDFFSKWGAGFTDNLNLVVAKRTFGKIVPKEKMIRPREGDLIYIPVMEKIFEIKFVEEEKLFYTHSNRIPFVYELSCEAFRSANEIINTGLEEIDDIDVDISWTIELTLTGVGHYNKGERVYQGANLTFATAKGKVSNWDGANNNIYIYEVVGQFEPGSNVIGSSTGTSRLVSGSDTMGDHTYYDLYDNKGIQLEANTIIDSVEINPFGAP